MGSQKPVAAETVDGLLKSLLVLSRTVDQVVETHAVETALEKPLSFSKVQVLRLLGNRGGQTASQVARYLGVTKPAVTQIVDALVRARLVVRRQAVHDRREFALELTKLGREKFRAVRRGQRHLLRNAVRHVKRTDADRWNKTLQEITNALANADRAFKQYCLQCGGHTNRECILTGGEADCLFLEHVKRPARRARLKAGKE